MSAGAGKGRGRSGEGRSPGVEGRRVNQEER